MPETIIVLGGGLAGMSAANTVMENGGKVVLLDKSAFCGGNSTKATSGINGANTKSQRAHGIQDSIELFTSDCMKGGAKKPDLIKVLAENSGPDCDWLMDVFGLDLSLVARLGGHSAPRTHRGKERFPGMTITYALIQMVEKIASMGDIAKVVTKACADKLIQDGRGAVIGCEYLKGGQRLKEMGPVIIATGGFGADFASDSLLAKHRPDLMHLPTSNGEHCTGDGIKLGVACGGATIDLEWVQVHPTGLVNPKDPDAKVKFLAAEALRGVGGLIFDNNGNRFANELGRRDYVTGEMWKNPAAPFRLCLNKAASDEIIWHCKHYTGRGVMKFYASGADLAREMGVQVDKFEKAHELHYQASLMQEKSPEGGPYPAYPSGKSWDEPSGKTNCGKKFFHNVIPGSKFASEPFYVAIITPIIHYCMGGLEISTKSEVLNNAGRVIPGLYCAGECMGGVHGNNRLGGNSLLDCVVYGRVSGKACAEYLLGNNARRVDLKQLSGGGVSGGGTQKSALSGGSYEDAPGNPSAAKPAAAAVPAAASGGGGGIVLSVEEVAKHTTEEDCWVILDGKVLDVTTFLPDHPGGKLAILTFGGKDATEEFNMIHPPDVVGKYAPEAIIGNVGDRIGGGGGGGDAAVAAAAPTDGAKYYNIGEVSKHNTEKDCWVVINGDVLDVTKFLPDHPGGVLAIVTFGGKDATEEFNMIHPPDVIGKYAPDVVIGKFGDAPAVAVSVPAAGGGLGAPLLSKGDALANEHAWGAWRAEGKEDNPGVLYINAGGWFSALLNMASAFLYETFMTLFTVTNFKFSNDRVGLTRSAILLILFMVIHAVGNLHVFLGPDDFNGYGYFYVRLYWTSLGIVKANAVEVYIALGAMLHVMVALKRTWDINRNYTLSSGKLNLAMTGSLLLAFMILHLFQFRFGATQEYLVRPPPYLINFWGILKLQLFWTDDKTVDPVAVRDIYKLEFDLFAQPIWVCWYMFSTTMFLLHACWGWAKLVPSSGFHIPKPHQYRVTIMGYCIMAVVALCYFSFPMYCYFCPMKKGNLGHS